MKYVKIVFGIALAFVVIGGLVSCEIAIWRECLADHGWLYCMRTIH
jgi:hypothetical protein